jgi:acyl-CoA thioester hydrolase
VSDSDPSLSVIPIRVRFGETDLMGIVHHASYLGYFEVARVEWLRRRGVTYAEWAARGVHLPVVDADLRYRMPAHFDEVLDVETRLTELRGVSMRFSYRIAREGSLLTEGSTRLACVDAKHQLMKLEKWMSEILRRGESPETVASRGTST